MGWTLAVHVGAGRYGERSAAEAAYVALVRSALETGRQRMTDPADTDGRSGVTRAVRVATYVLGVLERSELTNCGRGSNLTAAGVVECEASVLCGRSHAVGACGAVRGVAEPSALARTLLANAVGREKRDDDQRVGREPPLVLVGEGARAYAASVGLETAENGSGLSEYHVTEKARRQWRVWHAVAQGEPTRDQSDGGNDVVGEQLDTVGVVCMDPQGNVAAALSSGGVLYKVPGRVGLAGCPRAGGDARNARSSVSNDASSCGFSFLGKRRKRRADSNARNGYAIACTGRGEHFIRSAFVQTLAGRLVRHDCAMDQAMRTSFEDAQDDNGGEPLEGGVLALSVSPLQRRSKRIRSSASRTAATAATSELIDSARDPEDDQAQHRTVQLGVAFTTPCMGVGYYRDGASEPLVQILRQPDAKTNQLVVHVSCFTT